MSEAFDPYRKWLGIPPKDRPPNDRPPNHYRLLSIELFEDDPDAISNAADRQMAHVRTFQTGQHSELSQKLLNELSAARVCLLNKVKKAEYDAALRQEHNASEASATPAPVSDSVPPRTAAPLPIPRPLHSAPAVVPRPVPRAAPLPVTTPSVELPAAPNVPQFQYAMRRRGSRWQTPAALVATLALVAGAVLIAVKLGGQNRADHLSRPGESKIAAKPTMKGTKEPNPPTDDAPDSESATPAVAPSNERPNDAHAQPPASSKTQPDTGIEAPLAPDSSPSIKPSPESTKPSAPAIASAKPGAPLSGQADLMGFIELKRDTVVGNWLRDAEGVVSPASGLARLRIPVAMPDEYVVALEVERLAGDGAFGLGLAAGDNWTVAWLDGRGAFATGLFGIEGSVNDRRAGRLALNERAALGYCVRNGRTVLMRPDMNGAGWHGVIVWAGDVGMWNWPEGWNAPEKGRLELISSNSRFRIRRCVASTVTGPTFNDGNVASFARRLSTGGGNSPRVNPQSPLGGLLTTPEKKSPAPTVVTLAEARRGAEAKAPKELQTAKTPDQRLFVARKCQRLALDENAGSAQRYAMYDVAREQAALAGSSKLAFEVIDELAKTYEVDELDLRITTLEEASKAPPSPAGKKEQFDSARELIDQCVDLDRFPDAIRVSVWAQAAARLLKDPSLTKQIAERKKNLDKLAKAYAAISGDLERLKTNADDAEANLAVGRFYCLSKEDWQRGLPHLAAGNDSTLKELAERELSRPQGADAEKSLGDEWWELSRKDKGGFKSALAGRAAFWYRRAVAFLSGIEKEAVEQKLKDAGTGGRTSKTQFLSEMSETKVVVLNNWFAKGRNAVEKNKPLTVAGRESPHGLFTHPRDNGFASVTYDLGKKARSLSLEVAVDDGARGNPTAALVFQVIGDGRVLWTSLPIKAKGLAARCDVKVVNVTNLELKVHCQGRAFSAHAVWLEPMVTWK